MALSGRGGFRSDTRTMRMNGFTGPKGAHSGPRVKGYGFIQPDNGGKDVFVHISAVERSGMSGLAEGMKITYDVEADRKTGKESATNLKVA